MKNCTKCGKLLPETLEYFSKQSRNKSGLRGECKSCQAQKNKEWYSENRQAILVRGTKQREKNREYMRKKSLSWYYENKERAKATVNAWRKNNKEYYLDSMQKYREKNRSLRTSYAQKRIARIHSLPATLTNEQWDKIKDDFANTCAYCGAAAPLEQDHVIPVTKGGGYTQENIVPACASCNCSKGNKNFLDWYTKQKFYSADRKDAILRAVAGYAVQRSESA